MRVSRCFACGLVVVLPIACSRDWDSFRILVPGPDGSAGNSPQDASQESPADASDASVDPLGDKAEPDAFDSALEVDALDSLDGQGCEAGSDRCDGDVRQRCEEGSWVDLPCASPTPHCAGKGECVECTQADHCSGAAACTQVECSSNHQCTSNLLEAGTPAGPSAPGTCKKSVCDADGGVVEIEDDSNADDLNPCTADACASGTASHVPQTGLACGLNGLCSNVGACEEKVQGCGNVGGLQPGSPWPMVDYCPTHPGRSPYGGPLNNLYIAASSDQEPGSWGGRGVQSATGVVFLGGSSDLHFTAFAAGTAKMWSYNASTSAECSAVGADGTVYVPTNLNPSVLYALTPGPTSATLQWSHPFNRDGASCPVIGGDGTIYLGAGNDVVAVDAKGSEKWHFPTGDRVVEAPAIDFGGLVIAGSWDHHVYWLDPATGQLLHAFQAQALISTSPVVDTDGTVYVGAGDADKNLYALSSTGQKLAAFATGLQVITPVLGADHTLYVPSWDKHLYAIKRAGGAFNTTWDKLLCGAPTGGTILSANDRLYTVTGHGCDKLYALNPGDGAVLSEIPNLGPLAGISSAGVLYAARGDTAVVQIVSILGN